MARRNNDFFEAYKHPKWQKKRLIILDRDEYMCRNCGESESQLHIHHLYYLPNYKPWEYDDDALLTLCEKCHKEFTEIATEIRKNIGLICNTDSLLETSKLLSVIGNNPPYIPLDLRKIAEILISSDSDIYSKIMDFIETCKNMKS